MHFNDLSIPPNKLKNNVIPNLTETQAEFPRTDPYDVALITDLLTGELRALEMQRMDDIQMKTKQIRSTVWQFPSMQCQHVTRVPPPQLLKPWQSRQVRHRIVVICARRETVVLHPSRLQIVLRMGRGRPRRG
ncbi:hypothetical protein JCM10295v2_003127 [Rhodotorula toruloides]